MVCHSDCNHSRQRLLQYTNVLSIIDKESVILSNVSTAFALRMLGEIKNVPVLLNT